MKICIPIRTPNGLDSCVEPHLPNAEHLLFFDTETREVRHLSLRGDEGDTIEQFPFEVVLCESLDEVTKRALSDRGILAFGTEARRAGDAIVEFEEANPTAAVPDEDVPEGDGQQAAHDLGDHAHGGGCGCGEHGHGRSGGRNGCDGRGGCGGRGHDENYDHAHDKPHEGGCGCSGQAPSGQAARSKMQAEALKIAVSSQNRKTITDHAGRCRKFWVYEIRGNKVDSKTLRELSMEQTLHSSSLGDGHPLDDVHVMITTGMSPFLYQRLERGGIKPYVTEEADPDKAVELLLDKVARSSAAPS